MFHAVRFDVTENQDKFTQELKTFQDSPSYQILRHMYETLNIDENKN